MDVTCNRCGTTYEFEEGLISSTGTTVKCTQCGHLFKVHRAVPPPVPALGEVAREGQLKWRVRREDGSTHTLDTLAELTRLIAAGQFHRDDEISRTGQVWRKLGEISELASMFEAPRRARRLSDAGPEAGPSTPRPRAREEQTLGPAEVTEVDRRIPVPPAEPRRAEPRFETLGVEVDLEARTQRVPPVTDATAAEVVSLRAGSGVADDDLDPTRRTENENETMDLDVEFDQSEPQDELQAPPAAISRPPLWPLLIGLPLVIAAGVAGALFVRARQPIQAEDPSRTALERGDQALASHRIERFPEAVAAYKEALVFHKDDPHILSSISRVHAIWSQELLFREQPALARGTPGAATSTGRTDAGADGGVAERAAPKLAEQAKRYGEWAAQRNPGNEEASVAFADALRLNGRLVAARAEFDRARATEGLVAAEALRVSALLAIDEANGDFKAGRAIAERAVAIEPRTIRMLELLAYCAIAEGDFERARGQVAAIRAIDRDHPLLLGLEAALGRASQVAQATDAAAGSASAAPPAQPEPAAGLSSTKAGKTSASNARNEAPPPVSSDPVELSRRGEAALERGGVQAAERAFQAALELDPHSARARTGLGYVALERSEPELAVNHFRTAAKEGRAEAWIGLGDAYRRLGRLHDALEAYQTYLKRYPNGLRASIARRQTELLAEQVGDGTR